MSYLRRFLDTQLVFDSYNLYLGTNRETQKLAKRKRKTLPKNFDDLLKASDLKELKAVFDHVDVNAYGGVFKQTALAFNECPDELAKWLVEKGADILAVDMYGETPLHARAGHWQGRLEVLIELGADVNHMAGGRGSPLHCAAGAYNSDNVMTLIAHGAKVDAINNSGLNPLHHALARCSNSNIVGMAAIAKILLPASKSNEPQRSGLLSRLLKRNDKPTKTDIDPKIKQMVTRIGTDFEFHRSGFNSDMVEETSRALNELYRAFNVSPVPSRAIHDGISPIITTAATWQERHSELWSLLVPSTGCAETVQGEVIRIAGKINDELDRNGGVNWRTDHKNMAKAYLIHIGSGKALDEAKLSQAKSTILQLDRNSEGTNELDKWAVEWIALNPKPIKLPKPTYDL